MASKLNLPQTMRQAAVAYSRRDWVEADRLCRLILNSQATHFEALTLLGIIAAQTQRVEESAELLTRAAAANPTDASAHNNLGNALLGLRRPLEALTSYDQAVKLAPGYAQAHYNRGNALRELGRLDEALASYDQALMQAPDYAEAYINRGNALLAAKRLREALASFDGGLKRDPDDPEAWLNRGIALQELRLLDDALASFDEAIRLAPGYAEAYFDRGNALRDLNCLDDAVAAYDQALSFAPDDARFHVNRASALQDLRRLDEALAGYSRALILKPDLSYLSGARLHTKMEICDWSNARTEITELLDRIQRNERAAPPFAILAMTGSLQLQRNAAGAWISDRCPPIPERGNVPKYPGRGKIRVGYFSPDFRMHPVSQLTAELFEMHDRSRFEIIAFSTGPDANDEMRRRLTSAFDQFVDVRNRSDGDVSELARRMEIDIAVDLGGLTQGSRTGIFSGRCAPLQVNFLGYPGTMGAPYMDYIVADNTIIPESHRGYYAEKIAYLPSYLPGDSKRAVAVRPFAREEFGLPPTGFVFCCFNNHFKITPDAFDSWIRILAKVDGSVLWLSENHSSATANLRKEASARGIDAERLVFAKRMPSIEEHRARHRLADLFLDTFPYNAHATASDALWMGLPVLTCTSEAFAGRVAASLLNAIGLPELIVSTPVEYETAAVALAANPGRLKEMRDRLKRNRAIAPLFDTRRYARSIEDAYAQMHKRHRSNLQPDHIFVAP